MQTNVATSTGANNVEALATKSLQTELGNIKPKKHPNRCFWKGLGPHLGRVWAGLGPLLSALEQFLVVFGASCGRSWALLTRFLSVRHRASMRYWSKLASQRPSGSILGSSWRSCQRNWEILGGSSAILDKISADGNVLLAPSYKSAASAARPIQ